MIPKYEDSIFNPTTPMGLKVKIEAAQNRSREYQLQNAIMSYMGTTTLYTITLAICRTVKVSAL